MSRPDPKTQMNQLISGYKLQSELNDGEKLQDLVLDSPDGKLYYQAEAHDLNQDPNNICDLWQTGNQDLTVRIRRNDGRVDSLVYIAE